MKTAIAATTLWLVPVLPASAAITDVLVGTVDQTVDTTTDVIDGTVGSTGTALDPVVSDTTSTLDDTTGALTGAVDETVGTLTGTSDQPEDSPGGETGDTGDPVTEGISGDPTTGAELPAGSSPDGSDSSRGDSEADAGAVRFENEGVPPSSGSVSSGPAQGGATATGLRVLASAGGSLSSAVTFSAPQLAVDSSIYGRLLSWLAEVGSDGFGFLAGPLLGLEILLRALLSAGAGLVAPMSLLAAWVLHLCFDRRPSVGATA